jgi:hypothetical protein
MSQAMTRDQEAVEQRARGLLASNPDIVAWIRTIAAMLTVVAVIAALIALISPIPGDEIPAAALASALFRIATARQVYPRSSPESSPSQGSRLRAHASGSANLPRFA